MKHFILITSLVMSMALGLSACGGTNTTVQQNETQGQQLLDLKAALDAGVITDKEYEKTRKKILAGK